MQCTQYSPVHSSRNLLCGDASGGGQSVNHSSLGYLRCSPHLQPRGVGERASSPTTPTFMVPTLALEWNPRAFHSMDPITSEYYTNLLPMYTSNPPQFSGYCLIDDNRFTQVPDAYGSLMSAHQFLGTSVDFEDVFSEPVAAHQPLIPPAAPEWPILPSAAFHYYSCRWLSGPQCNGLAPGRNREMGEHLRVVHHFIGHERDPVQCEWENCGQTMQRMNVPRHVVSRHLLAAACCRFCRKRFSRPDVVSRHERTCSGISPVSNTSTSGV